MSPSREVFDAIGTSWSIETATALPTPLLVTIHQRIEQFDRTYSRFRPDSLVSAFAATGGSCEFPPDAIALLHLYRELYELTGGRVSPLVGSALEHLGYDAGYSLRRRPGSATVPRWTDVLTVEGTTVSARKPVLLDFGAAGKGYLIDLLALILREHDVGDYLVDGSGDLARRGQDVFRVGLEHPADPTKVIGVANVTSGALCGSAGNRRAWGDGLHHIVDPRTGEPATEILATWVVAESALIADGLATALFFAEPRDLAARFSFSYVRMPATGGVEYSTNFDGELFT
ncbi:thiamine biosynthesis lipoprotein [Nakamurella sp. UYEF19]|uniref:FAD:protein FMN transferase n=1 Tax=Nakamurella sp. UYEF19 TaxID=1756392 RepID=UPI0033990A10